MFLPMIFSISVFLITSILVSVLSLQDIYHGQRGQILKNDLAAIVEAVEEYKASNPTLPYDAIGLMLSSTEYDYLRSRNTGVFQFKEVRGLSDGYWRFDRMAFWFESPFSAVGNATYLLAANNSCGSQAFNVSKSWCGRKDSVWAKAENKIGYGDLLLAEKQRLYRTVSKFYRRYNEGARFSNVSNGTAISLPSLVGYAGTAINCGGVFVHFGIPLTCQDLFNYWGNPVVLNKLSDSHIVLVDRTEIRDASGQFVRVAEEAKLD